MDEAMRERLIEAVSGWHDEEREANVLSLVAEIEAAAEQRGREAHGTKRPCPTCGSRCYADDE